MALYLVRSLMTRDSHCDRIYSSIIAVDCDGYVAKQSVALKDHCAGFW